MQKKDWSRRWRPAADVVRLAEARRTRDLVSWIRHPIGPRRLPSDEDEASSPPVPGDRSCSSP